MRDQQPPRRSGWIPWAIAGLAGFMLIGSVVLSLVASNSDPGLVAGSPARMAGTNLTPTGLGPVVELRVVRRAADEVVVEARLRGPGGRPESAEALEGVLHRSTHARDDQPVPFTQQSDGSWRATIRVPDAGLWDLAVQARGTNGAAGATLRL